MKEKMSPSLRSQLALDGVSFCITDIPNGLGAFTATYLQSDRHWDPGTIGAALSSAGIAAMVTQIPAAAVVDIVRQKKGLFIWCSVAVAMAALGIVSMKPFLATVLFEIVIGAITTFIAPLIAAISLGLVGRAQFDRRLGRTSAYSHAGNVMAAILAGWLGFKVSQAWVFYLIAILNLTTVIFVLFIRSNEIDFDIARGGDGEKQEGGSVSLLKLCKARSQEFFEAVREPKMIVVGLCFFSFQLAGAGILQLVGQNFGTGASKQSALYMAASIVVAQLVMIPASWMAGVLAGSWGRKTLLLIGFVCVPIRALLCALTTNPTLLVLIQSLDGVAAGLFNVVSILMISDLTEGTSRFNAMQGFAATAMGLGAALSALLAGFLAKMFHFPVAYMSLGVIGLAASLIFLFFLPETLSNSSQNGLEENGGNS